MDFVLPLRVKPLELVAGRGHYERVIQAVLAAKRSVWIATANLKELLIEPRVRMPGRRPDYRSVLETFDELAQRGVELRILHASLPSRPFRDEFDRHARLVRGGLELRMCPCVHLKTVIVDGALLYLGSANWTGAGLGVKGEGRRNFELGIVSDDEQLLDQVQAMFQSIWSGQPCSSCRLRESCEAPLDAARASSPVAPPAATAARRSSPAPPAARRSRPRR
jgi:phosphatidylserine/phosphatidylglycerophosphate/cardiolipin synthase-like enzyme